MDYLLGLLWEIVAQAAGRVCDKGVPLLWRWLRPVRRAIAVLATRWAVKVKAHYEANKVFWWIAAALAAWSGTWHGIQGAAAPVVDTTYDVIAVLFLMSLISFVVHRLILRFRGWLKTVPFASRV